MLVSSLYFKDETKEEFCSSDYKGTSLLIFRQDLYRKNSVDSLDSDGYPLPRRPTRLFAKFTRLSHSCKPN